MPDSLRRLPAQAGLGVKGFGRGVPRASWALGSCRCPASCFAFPGGHCVSSKSRESGPENQNQSGRQNPRTGACWVPLAQLMSPESHLTFQLWFCWEWLQLTLLGRPLAPGAHLVCFSLLWGL